jgi:acetolactate synthase-1/2/3 large subunit
VARSDTTLISPLPFSRDDIEQTVPARFEQVVRCFPGNVALTGPSQQWTYADLNRRVNRMAHAILGRTRPKEIGCVAFLVGQSPEMVMATLAVLKAGKAYLGIHPDMPAAAQRDIIRDAAPELILTTAELASRAREIAGEGCDVLAIDQLDENPDHDPMLAICPQDPSTIFYTSGTTGKPKGVVKSHRSVLHRVWLSTQHDVIVPEDRQSLLTHASFSASESDMFAALLQGATVCVFDIASQGFPAFRTWIEEERITLLHPPVLLFRRFLSTLEGANLFPSVRLVALAGDVVLPADVEKWRQHFAGRCTLLHRFSTAETALLTVAHIEREAPPESGAVAAGRPVLDKTLVLVDEAGQAVPQGETGELMVRSLYLADGYWRHSQETAAAFQFDPHVPGQKIYRTGDLGRFLPDGSLEFLGRREHLAKIRGYRVDTREVESVMTQLEDVSAAAVIVRKEHDEDRLAAFVVMRQGAEFDARVLRERLRVELPEWKIPARIEPIFVLPTTLSGKVDRQLLRSMLGPAAKSAVERSSMDALTDIWRVTLGRDAVGLDDHFLDLGGDSISAMMTLNSIERHYGVRLTLATFYQHATIRGIATVIKASKGHENPATEQQALAIENISDAFVEMLNAQGVDYVFINPGTDTAPILESIAKFEAQGRRTPQLILCLHESLAMAAAHGYFMVSGRTQVVMVHVDVGTQNLGANLHNAQRGRAGVVICAGRAPYTVDGGVAGGRNRYNHWIQEQFNQSSIVQGYVKWHYELTRGENLSLAVHRAFQIAGAEPAGPVYLTLPREVLMEKAGPSALEGKSFPSTSPQAFDPSNLALTARWLIEAENPLILVAYAGRNPRAVASLVRLAETLAAPVVESRHRVNFPSSHPLHLGYSPVRALPQADCVLIVDHDVPWVPAQGEPKPDAKIIQIDNDPLKRDIPLWGFSVDVAIQADSSMALRALADEIERQLTPAIRTRIEARRRRVSAEHRAQALRLQDRALELAANKPIAPEWAACCLNEILDENTIVVSEAVTNSPVLWNYLRRDTPGTFFQSLGSGLGWGLGAALGAKLANPSKTVICTLGDGSWLFANPIAAYWTAQEKQIPFLTVIFNNQQYFATAEAILTVAPAGSARKSGNYPGCDLPKPPMFSRIAEALGLWAKTVEEPAELPFVLREALQQVRAGRSAVVDICVWAPRPGQDES